MRRILLIATLLAATAVPALAQPVTQADLLHRLIDLDRLMTPPVGERTGLFSSYDRRSRIDAGGKFVDWNANRDRGQFLRDEADGWQVMAEIDGPGTNAHLVGQPARADPLHSRRKDRHRRGFRRPVQQEAPPV